MRAFVCELDHHGLRRFLPEDLVPGEEWHRLALPRTPRPSTLIWALLHDRDAEDLRIELHAGRHRDACGLLLNRAVELLPLAAAVPEAASARPMAPTPSGAG